MKNYAIVLASGVGSRMKLNTPKQFLKLSGKSVLQHTLIALDRSQQFDEILLVINQQATDPFLLSYFDSQLSTRLTIHPGGKTRNLSAYQALSSLSDEDAKVLIHDAVRPFISSAIVKRVLDALDNELAVDTAIPTADTIIRVNSEMYIENIPKRDVLFRGQTPQGFKLCEIKAAYEKAIIEGETNFPDDCSIFLKYHPNAKVKVVLGESTNMKITDQVDFSIAEKIFQLQKVQLTGPDSSFFPSQLKNKVLIVFGSSSGIGEEIVRIAQGYGMKVFGFSRSMTGTYVEDENSVTEAINKVIHSQGQIDYVVNTAGFLLTGPISSLSTSQVADLLNINLLGHINVIRSSLPHLKKSKGSILGFGSSSYMRGRSNYALYSASKAALVNLTQAIAEEEESIRINLISPERTRTPMRQNSFGSEDGINMLSAAEVATYALKSLLLEESGSIFDVKISVDEVFNGMSS